MSLLSDEFMTKRLRANGLPVDRAIRHHEEQKWTYYLAGGLALDVPYSVTENNLSPTIVEWVRDQIDPSPWTIAMFMEHVDRAREKHGGISGRIVMTERDWKAIRDAFLATGVYESTLVPNSTPPDAVGMVYGLWVSLGERTSFPCADGTDLAEAQ